MLFVFFYEQISAQQSFSLKITPSIADEHCDILKSIPYNNKFPNEQARNKELRNFLYKLYDNGYIAAYFDSLTEDSVIDPFLNAESRLRAETLDSLYFSVQSRDSAFKVSSMLIAYINPGGIYKWATIKPGNVDEGILSKVGFREKLYSNKPINYKEVRKLHEKLLTYCENNGYPFAWVKLDSVKFSDTLLEESVTLFKTVPRLNLIEAQLNLAKNIEVHIDSIIIKGDAKITPVYIYNHLGIKPGDLYDESLVSKIGPKLEELPFVKQTKPFKVVFTEKDTKIILLLTDKKASIFNGILGVLPNSETTGKLLITGEARLKLLSSLGRGELIDIDWRSLQPKTQDLKARFVYPFILSSPFGVDLKLKLYKKDTLYLDLHKYLGIQYLLSGTNYLQVFINNKTTSLLAKNTTVLPYANVNTIIYGLGYKNERLDYRLNPTKGYQLNINAGAGNKTIQETKDINPDSVVLKSTEYDLDIDFDLFMPIKNRGVANFGIKAAYLSSKSIFENELFRMGGISTLRGFDEESMLASAYAVFTLEYRYLLEQNSYLYLFFDGAYYENEYRRINNLGNWLDRPFGFGAGISFETKAGIFSINYALGKQLENPIMLKSAKIHFGIVNHF
ncbi:MAG: BamA/TamA family outer membrane protein [Bacteroidota bacterium]